MRELLNPFKKEIKSWGFLAFLFGSIIGHVFWNAYLGVGPELFNMLLSRKALIEIWVPLGGMMFLVISLFVMGALSYPKKSESMEAKNSGGEEK